MPWLSHPNGALAFRDTAADIATFVAAGYSTTLAAYTHPCYRQAIEEWTQYYNRQIVPTRVRRRARRGTVAEYHSQPRNYGVVLPTALGVELEVLCHAGGRRKVAEKAFDLNIIAEEDGSLDTRRGVELVGPPMTLAEYWNPDSRWAAMLAYLKTWAKGWDAGPGYGMHISMNRVGMSSAEQKAVVCLVSNNPHYFIQIAGRNPSHYAAFSPKSYRSWDLGSSERHDAVALKDNRLELRICRSTTNPVSFLKNVEVAASIRQWATTHRATTLLSYHRWLMANMGDYPSLSQWLGLKKERLQHLNLQATKPGLTRRRNMYLMDCVLKSEFYEETACQTPASSPSTSRRTVRSRGVSRPSSTPSAASPQMVSHALS